MQSKIKKNNQNGFTIVELLIIIVIIGLLMGLLIGYFRTTAERARLARAQSELQSISKATITYMIAEQDIPPDVSRGLPSGVEDYLSNDSWPQGPWSESVYDWDSYAVDGNVVLQVSLRFCDTAGNNCSIPNFDWADDFDSQSSLYYCIFGPCQAHAGAPADHPGICVNCGNNEEF